jgi:alkylation response protein AidB-like acyl-CoA dehydrogenase
MHFGFTEEQEELREMARAFLSECSSSEQVREAMDKPEGYDPEVWGRIGAELGWPAVTIPEEYGGIGMTYVELVALMEEMGKVLLCSPFFSTVCLGVNTLLEAGTEEQKQSLLPEIAEGNTTATLAFSEDNGRWDATAVEATATKTATKEGDAFILKGCKSFVADGHTAEHLIIAARSEGTQGEEGISLFLVKSDTPGVVRTRLDTLDQTRAQAKVELQDVSVPASALMGEEGGAWPALKRALDLAAIALAAEQVGGAQRCLDMSVEYAKERVQFGRKIGSFQAIKHKCANMSLQVESARSAVYYAAWAAAENEPDLSELASIAKAYCSDTYNFCSGAAIQVHGGVGFTWEYDCHLFFKRANSSQGFLGSPAYHRELVAQHIGL